MPNDLYVNILIKNLNTTTKLLQANNLDTLTGKVMTNLLTTVSNTKEISTNPKEESPQDPPYQGHPNGSMVN
jgi:hypothetical protein